MKTLLLALCLLAVMPFAATRAAESDTYCIAPLGTGTPWQPCSPILGLSSQPMATNSADHSGTVASTGVYQTVLALRTGTQANPYRHGCTITNTSADQMSVRINGATVFPLAPGQPMYCSGLGIVIQDSVEITGNASDTYAATEQ